MRRAALGLGLLGLTLAGCGQPGATSAEPHGKYAGIGLYTPGRPWTRLVAQTTGDPHAARLVDDQAIIVVQNTATGEVRACGDLTGYCIGMNPWRTDLVSSHLAPVQLTEHEAPMIIAPAPPMKPSGG